MMMAPPRSKLFTKFKNHFALTGAQILRVSDLLLGTVGILNTAGMAEQGVHRVHVHPQFFWRRKQKLLKIFPYFDLDANVHPQFLALYAIPAYSISYINTMTHNQA